MLSQSILPTWNIWQLMKQNVWNECPPVAEPRNTVIGGSQKVLCPSRHYRRTFDTQAITSEGGHVFEWTYKWLPSDTSWCNFLKNCAPDILWIPMGWGSAVYITSQQSVSQISNQNAGTQSQKIIQSKFPQLKQKHCTFWSQLCCMYSSRFELQHKFENISKWKIPFPPQDFLVLSGWMVLWRLNLRPRVRPTWGRRGLEGLDQ